MSRVRALFERFPPLRALEPLDLCAVPTPVHALPSLGERAFVKRDDVTHAEYGGNKLRKLEYVGAEITRRRAKRAITFGATGTSAGVAAAMVCRQLGVACEVLTFDQPPSPTVTKNAALLSHYGARVRHIGPLFWTALAWQLDPRRLDPRNYFLFAGCSNPVATYGYVDAAFELKAQIDAGACPSPTEIVVAVGSCATVAGLTLGCALAGIPARVRGVRVAPLRVGPFDSVTEPLVDKMIDACRTDIARRTGEKLANAPRVWLDHAWFGAGYGAATEAGDRATAALASVGIGVEPTYTAKAAAAFLASLEGASGPVLFWSTYSSAP